MSGRPSFEEIVERCIDDIQRGRATPEQCLERWSQWRADLEPILETFAVLDAAPRMPERAPDPARRSALMTAVRELPQEPPRRLLPRLSLPSLPVGGLALRFAAAAVPAAAVAVLAFVLVMSPGAAPASAATLAVFAGDVELQRDGRWQPAVDGAAVGEGDGVRTLASGWALLAFEDGSSVTLDPETEIVIERAQFEGARQVILRQATGRLWNDVAPARQEGARYAVETPDTTIEALGTVFESTVEDGLTTVVTAEGLVQVISQGAPIAVARGEMARAQAGLLTEHRAASMLDAAVMVRAPFAATLLSERGAATGARSDGLILHQVRGVTTSALGLGPQRFDLQNLRPGVYTLFLERFDEGGGELVLRTAAGERVIALGEDTQNVQLRLEVTDDMGLSKLQLLDDQIERPGQRPQVRVPAQVAARAATTTPARPAATTPATATAERTPPDFVVRAQAEREAFREAIQAAMRAGDRDRLRRLIDEALDESDPALLRARMSVLTQVLGDDRLNDLMRDALIEETVEPERPAQGDDRSDDDSAPRDRPRGGGPPSTPPGLADRLERALREAGPPAAAEHLERVLRPRGAPTQPGRGPEPGRGAQESRETPTPSETQTADVTPTPTRTTETATPTPTRTPSLLPGVGPELEDAVDDLLNGSDGR